MLDFGEVHSRKGGRKEGDTSTRRLPHSNLRLRRKTAANIYPALDEALEKTCKRRLAAYQTPEKVFGRFHHLVRLTLENSCLKPDSSISIKAGRATRKARIFQGTQSCSEEEKIHIYGAARPKRKPNSSNKKK